MFTYVKIPRYMVTLLCLNALLIIFFWCPFHVTVTYSQSGCSMAIIGLYSERV